MCLLPLKLRLKAEGLYEWNMQGAWEDFGYFVLLRDRNYELSISANVDLLSRLHFSYFDGCLLSPRILTLLANMIP